MLFKWHRQRYKNDLGISKNHNNGNYVSVGRVINSSVVSFYPIMTMPRVMIVIFEIVWQKQIDMKVISELCKIIIIIERILFVSDYDDTKWRVMVVKLYVSHAK